MLAAMEYRARHVLHGSRAGRVTLTILAFSEALVFEARLSSIRLLRIAAMSLILPLLAVGLCSRSADAQTRAQQEEQVKRLQYLLLWTGDYLGQLDGRPGALLAHALRSYQRKAGFRRGEALDAAQLGQLSNLAQRSIRQLDYAHQPDPGGGHVALPRAILMDQSAAPAGVRYHTAENALEVETVHRPSEAPTLLELYRSLLRAFAADALATNIFGGDHFIISGHIGDTTHSLRFEEHGSEIRGIKIRFRRDADPRYPFLSKAMIHDFVPFGEPVEIGAPPALPEIRLATRAGPDAERRSDSSGSGFVVSTRGHVLTNAHVIVSCDDIRVGNNRTARLVAVQNGEDLALLQVAELGAERAADFAGSEVLLGEDVAVFGYPLRPILAEQLNMTTGIVSSLRGLSGDPGFIQISASLQPGHSGGPVVDLKGRVVGIATGVLRTARTARRPEIIYAPINLAIRHERMVRFLRAQGIEPKIAQGTGILTKTDLASHAASYTLPITCERR
jgi:serine protease Do